MIIIKVWIIYPEITVGGAERQCLELYRNLEKLGIDARLLTLSVNKKVNLFFDIEDMNIDVYKGTIPNTNRIFFKLLTYSIILKKFLKKEINIDKPDILNPHNIPSYWSCNYFNIPVIWMCNEPLLWIKNSARKITSKILQKIDISAVKKINKICVLDNKNKRRVKIIYNRDSTVCRSGVDYRFWSKKETASFRNDDEFLIVQVGHISEQKNQKCSVRALKMLSSEMEDVKLIFVGSYNHSPTYYDELVDLIKKYRIEDKVEFLGQLKDIDVRKVYASADVVLFPAIYQSWGLTPIEALCQKKISIVSSDSGVSEVLSENNIGVVCNPSPEEFAKNIKKVHEDPKTYRDMAKRGHDYVKNNLTWRHYAKRMLREFENTLFNM